MKKILGLDIGIASVGYSVINYDDEKFEGKILNAGVRVFDACEVSKTKESLNAKRRELRGVRRRLSRRASRLKAIRQLFIANDYLKEEEINNMFHCAENRVDVWDLRKMALGRLLTIKEFYRILHQIAKRRGFKSIRKSEEAKREGNLLKNISKNTQEFENSDFMTIGEMFATIYVDKAKRNKQDDYKNSIPRELLLKEVKTIFKIQRKFGANFANEDFEKKYIDIAFYQRPLQSMKGMIGKCQFEPNEKRAPKAAYTSEIFVAAQKLVNTKLITSNSDELTLNEEQIHLIMELAHKNSKVTYKQVRKLLNLEEGIIFKTLQYGKIEKDKKTGEEKEINPEENTLIELKKYQEFRNAIKKNLGEEYFEKIKYNKELFNNIAEVLTYEKSDEAITKELLKKEVSQEIIDCILNISASKVMHLSIKAMDKIIPYLLQGLKYSDACSEAGYDFKNSKNSKNLNYLPVLTKEELTTNPVVNRSISQTRKVVNALLRLHGKFDSIIIETARDLGKSVEERNKIKSGQDNFQKEKELAKQRCIENGVNPDSKNNLLRFRLWEEQGGYCPYSKKPIDIKRLSEPNYTDIDHIIPYSRCFDDSLNNKVLCLSDENRMKGNKIPYEYLCGKYDWYEYSAWIRELHLRSAKENRLLRKTYSSEDNNNFSSRNLNDTRYITIFIKDYIKDNLDTKVETRNGSLTAYLRKQWQITKDRDENDRHHAIDATVLACSTQGMVKYVSTISAKRENYDFINHSKPKFKKPWETFNEDLDKAINEIFVSRAPKNKIPGALHDATIRSSKHLDEGFTTLKTPIKNIKLKDLENMLDKNRNIEVYKILKERLEEFNDDPKKAFAEPVYMKLSEVKKEAGIKPHEIKSIKIKTTGTSGMEVQNGIANNTSMPRVDVFSKKNKKGKDEFYLVPIYVSDFAKGILPNKAIVAHKPESEWIIIDETFNFKFSLFNDTLISFNKTNNPEDETICYYCSTHRALGGIIIEAVDNNKTLKGVEVGVKSLYSLKKYQVDVLGNYHEVKNEQRQPIKFKNTNRKRKEN